MFQTGLGSLDLSKVVLAVGGLGTAAYGVVDASKSFWGGISNRGFGDIKKIISKLIPAPDNASGNIGPRGCVSCSWAKLLRRRAASSIAPIRDFTGRYATHL